MTVFWLNHSPTMCKKHRAYGLLVVTILVVICTLDYFYLLPLSGPQASFKFDERQKNKWTRDGEDDLLDQHVFGAQESRDISGSVYPAVHYIWCGNKTFRFKDYLSVLSAIKTFRPLKLTFHYTHTPLTDDYNVWFKNLVSDTPGLEMHRLSSAPPCGSTGMLSTALDFLSAHGGIFVGENTILSPQVLKDLPVNTDLWFAFSNNASDPDRANGLVVARTAFNKSLKKVYLKRITSTHVAQPACSPSLGSFGPRDYCLVIPGVVYPRDIIDAQTYFAELARSLFYGSGNRVRPVRDSSNPIPRISHFIRLTNGSSRNLYRNEFPFSHFLSVLSALHVAGFQRVYMHVDKEPKGRWWEELAKENVTLVKVVRPLTIFQQPVNLIQHVSDVARYMILDKYGGAYHDSDVVWTSYVPDSLLSYPVVAAPGWVERKGWPGSFNLGVLLAKPNTLWMRRYLQSHKDFRKDKFIFNSGLMSYRTYELYPHLMHVDRRLQEVRSLHVTKPKPHPTFTSPETVKEGKDMMAEIGRFILEKSGRRHLLF
ncbi:uncharacterized protein LOC143292086 isoform X2 [Babylonia areolata]|uniref:uncharacterized protein LOC143292086 isoform X2 n=1 Tax=Babylonia areolata TaxID=304850 RepID=UPI003FD69545